MKRRLLKSEEATRIFSYDQHTGKLYWKNSKRSGWNGKEAGSKVGREDRRTKYLQVRLRHNGYRVHSIVWVMVNGDMPDDMEIDHIDGDGLNNRINNLRLVKDQSKNKPLQKSNNSGVVGVMEKNGSYVAYISSNYKQIWLGTYPRKEDAVVRRKQAEKEYGYHLNHGR